MSIKLACPQDSSFYTCPKLVNRFVGCCDTPGCSEDSHRCPDADREPTSFTDYDGNITKCHPGSFWFTCPNASPLPFLGCCKSKSDPCSHGCPKEDLTQASVKDDPNFSDQMAGFILLPTNEASNSSTTSSVSLSSTSKSFDTWTSTYSSVPTANVAGQSAVHSDIPAPKTIISPALKIGIPPAPKSNAAAIAGGVVGGIVGLALLVGLLVICCRRRNTGPQHNINGWRSPAWDSGQPRSTQLDNAELGEMKKAVSSTSSPLRPPSPPSSPLLSPLPPPPAYTVYKPHGNELDKSPDHSHRSSSSPYMSSDIPSSELPPSPPPLENRLSQGSTDSYSDGRSVSPISSHYQHQPFDNSRTFESSAYSAVLREPLHNHGIRS